MVDLIAAVSWPLAFAYAAHRVAAVVGLFSPAAVQAKVEAGATDEVAVPEDLLALVASEQTQWAQEDVLRVIKERYEDLRDWNRVRRAMGIGELG
jgi:hypothetical protein